MDPVGNPPTEASYRAAFTAWLSGLGNEAPEVAGLLLQEGAPEAVRRWAAETLNQLFHALDHVPEGVEALGYLEALFAFRVLAQEACASIPAEPSDLPPANPSETLSRLAGEAPLIEAFLGGEDYARLSAQVLAERNRRSRGRSPAELLDAAESRNAAAQEARGSAERYRPPSFGSGSHDLVRLLSFLRTRVRRAPPRTAASAG